MSLNYICLLLLAAGVVLFTGCSASKPGSKKLEIQYGARGLEQLSYGGVVLEDLEQNPGDVFHIWHMNAIDSTGKRMTGRQYEWGEVNTARTWDAAKHTWKYFFEWGSISVEFAQAGDTLNMNVTEVNNANSNVTFNGATIYPMVLHFPRLPANFKDVKFAQLSSNTDKDPGTNKVIVADFGEGQVASLVPGPMKPLYHGFDPAGAGFNYVPIISSTSMDSMASFFPRIDRPVAPGKEDRFTVSLRFAPSGSPVNGLQ